MSNKQTDEQGKPLTYWGGLNNDHIVDANKKVSSIEWLYKELLNSEPNILEWNKLLEQAKEMHKQEIYQHAINFYLFVENDEVTDQKVEIIENLYKDYLKQFYNETFGK